ncbi:hypothetical protein N9Y79_03530 [Alphaproteobacteria bacterium]|nr:hypothetical protein [Alphaproteobacteria bacterium]MDB2641596.1 hypothetical protein [Alphaproteobacteria bacterium]
MKMPNMVITTLAAIAIITALGFWARDDGRVGNKEIGLEVGVPIEHRLTALKTTPLPVVLRLVNNTNEIMPLTADGPCKVFRYFITTSEGGFIQAMRKPEVCTETQTRAALAEQDVIEEIRQVPLDSRRYKPGKYVVRIRFWNYEGEAAFTLTN